MTDRYQKEIQRLAKKLATDDAKLTQFQLECLLDQLIKSGDIMQHITLDSFRTFSVTYLPYRERAGLEAKLAIAVEALESYTQWYDRTLEHNKALKSQGDFGSFGQVQHDVDVALRKALTMIKEGE